MIARSKLLVMLAMQHKMNAKVNEAWLSAGYPWLRAVVVEGVEAMGHHGWKWWKKESMEIEQLRIELVDIWHFALSHTIVQRHGSISEAAQAIVEQLEDSVGHINHAGESYVLGRMTMLNKLELMISMAACRQFSYPLFQSLMHECTMTWDDLLIGYVSKNVLNFFRQDNGYKAGTYIKNWFGEEDNIVLARIVKTMDVASTTFADELYIELASVYKDVLAKHEPVI